MRGLFLSFRLQLVAMLRTGALPFALAAALAAALLVPSAVRGDGTAGGEMQVATQCALAAGFAVALVFALAAAAGSFASERAAKRHALVVTRPAAAAAVWAGRYLAIACATTAILASAAAGRWLSMGEAARQISCRHRVEPALPPPIEEAERQYEGFLADPEVDAELKAAPKPAVLCELAKREAERYEAVRPGETAVWKFRPSSSAAAAWLQLRFAADFSLRLPVKGAFKLKGSRGAAASAEVDGFTQSVLELPLSMERGFAAGEELELLFENRGADVVMLRPRGDIAIMSKADSVAWNFARATVVMAAAASLLAAFAAFLSTFLGKSVCVFAGAVAVVITLMAPSVMSQFPVEIGAPPLTAMGLRIAKAVLTITRSVGELHPVASAAAGECVEAAVVLKAVLVNAVAVPFCLMLVSAYLAVRHPADD